MCISETFEEGNLAIGTVAGSSAASGALWEVAGLNTILRLYSASGLPAHLLLMGSGSHYSKDHQTPPLEEDCLYFTNLFEHALEEVLEILNLYTWCTSSSLALGGVGC